MRYLMLKEIPKYACIQEAAEQIQGMRADVMEAYLHLLRAGDEAYSISNGHLLEMGISKGGFTILLHLYPGIGETKGPMTPGELADQSGVTRATITGLVDTLCSEALVTRETDPNNRRQILVDLTPKGSAFLEKIFPEHSKVIADAMSALSEEENHQLVELLTKLTEGMLEFGNRKTENKEKI